MDNANQPSINKNKRERIVYLDVAKGFAILLVVAGHMIKTNPSIIKYGTFLSNLIYSFHMPVFFILSGMGIYLSLNGSPIKYDAFKNKCKKYVKRLLLSYFVWSLISFFLSSIKTQPNEQEWFWSIITFRGRAPIWFLGALFFGEIAFILIYFLSKGKITACVVTTIVSAAMTFISDYFIKKITVESLALNYLLVSVTRFFPVLFFLCLGFFIMWLMKKRELGTILCLIFGIVFAALTVIIQLISHNVVNMHLFKLGNPVIFFLGSICGSLALILISKALSNIIYPRLFVKLGENSLGIMMLHYIPFTTMRQAWLLSDYFSFLPGVLVYLIAVIIATAISYLAVAFIKNKLFL